MATPPTQAEALSESQANRMAWTIQQNQAFIDAATTQIQTAITLGQRNTSLGLPKNLNLHDLHYLRQYFVQLGYVAVLYNSRYNPTNAQPAADFGERWLQYWLDGEPSTYWPFPDTLRIEWEWPYFYNTPTE